MLIPANWTHTLHFLPHNISSGALVRWLLACNESFNAVFILYLNFCCFVVNSTQQVSVEPLPRGSMTLYQVAAVAGHPQPGDAWGCGCGAFVLTFGEQVDGTMVDGDSEWREIEMEMWGCLRFTVGMTGVSSPHLPVAATEIRKPSKVLCYTHLNGSCIDEP